MMYHISACEREGSLQESYVKYAKSTKKLRVIYQLPQQVDFGTVKYSLSSKNVHIHILLKNKSPYYWLTGFSSRSSLSIAASVVGEAREILLSIPWKILVVTNIPDQTLYFKTHWVCLVPWKQQQKIKAQIIPVNLKPSMSQITRRQHSSSFINVESNSGYI